jgi:pimeloyl-ACP methyl ester carboxylesterase
VKSEVVELGNGERLAYCRYGAANGTPVIYFHGFPGSRQEALFLHREALHRGVTVFAPNRPGIGASTYVPNRKLADWPAWMSRFADKVGIDRFFIFAVSGGAPYAHSTAWGLKDRVRGAAVVSGMGPVESEESMARAVFANRFLVNLGRTNYPLARKILSLVGASWSLSPYLALVWLRSCLPRADRGILDSLDGRAILDANLKEVFANGLSATQEEFRILVSPWGFPLEEIRAPFLVWHGEADHYVPVDMARRVAGRLPRVKTIFAPGAGHLAVFHRSREILAGLLALE